MNLKMLSPIAALALTAAASGQTVHKCPGADGAITFPPTPCQGEAIPINAPKPSGEGLRDSERSYLEERDKARQQAAKPEKSARSGEVEKECMDMKRRIAELEEREARGIHTWSKNGYEESHWRRKEYEELCR